MNEQSQSQQSEENKGLIEKILSYKELIATIFLPIPLYIFSKFQEYICLGYNNYFGFDYIKINVDYRINNFYQYLLIFTIILFIISLVLFYFYVEEKVELVIGYLLLVFNFNLFVTLKYLKFDESCKFVCITFLFLVIIIIIGFGFEKIKEFTKKIINKITLMKVKNFVVKIKKYYLFGMVIILLLIYYIVLYSFNRDYVLLLLLLVDCLIYISLYGIYLFANFIKSAIENKRDKQNSNRNNHVKRSTSEILLFILFIFLCVALIMFFLLDLEGKATLLGRNAVEEYNDQYIAYENHQPKYLLFDTVDDERLAFEIKRKSTIFDINGKHDKYYFDVNKKLVFENDENYDIYIEKCYIEK